MAKTIRGNTLASLMELVDGHTFDRDENGNEEVAVRYVTLWTARLTNLPDLGTDATALGYPDLFLARASFERDDGGQAIVTLLYKGSSLTLDGLPLASYQLAGAGQEVPIQQHPNFSTLSAAGWDSENERFEEGSLYYGIQSFLVPGATWTKTFYTHDKPSQAHLFGLGDISSPDDLLGVTPGKWILSNYNITNQGAYWQHQKTWTYDPSPLAWPVTISKPS